MIIKEKPEDFYVREVIDLSRKPEGKTFAYFLMWKRNLTTIRAIKIIAKKLGISKKRICFAGEKDKKAVTEQYIAIRNWKEKKDYDFGNVKLKYIGHFGEPLSPKDILYNYFRIRVIVNEKEKENFHKNIELIKKYGFFNYFDEQRFGDIRCNNHLIGKALIKRNWEEACKLLLTFTSDKENEKATEARKWLYENWGNWREALKKFPKWLDVELAVLNYLVQHPNDFLGALKKVHRKLLKLFVNSYQSYLWNKMVANYIKEKTNDYFILNENLHIVFTRDERVLKELENKEFPIIGYTTEETEEVRKILEEEGIKIDDFFFLEVPYLSAEGSTRKALEKVLNIKYEEKENEIILEFCLPRGCYATMLLKNLFLFN